MEHLVIYLVVLCTICQGQQPPPPYDIQPPPVGGPAGEQPAGELEGPPPVLGGPDSVAPPEHGGTDELDTLFPPPVESVESSSLRETGTDLANYCRRRVTIGSMAVIMASYPPPRIYAALNMNATTGEGWLDAWQPHGLCYRVALYRVVMPDKVHDLLTIYDSEVTDRLQKAQFLMGEPVRAVKRWAHHYRKSYTVFSPLPLYHEQLTGDTILTVWPSPTVFISSITLNTRLLLANVEMQNVMILTYGETVDLIEFVDRIRIRLEDDDNDRLVTVFTLSKELTATGSGHSNLPLVDQVYENLAKVRRRMEDVDLVIVYFEAPLEKKIQVLNLLFRKGADLEDENRPWLIADMRFPYEPGALEMFEEITALKTPVYMLWPEMGNDYSMMAFDENCRRSPGVGVDYQGLLRTKHLIQSVYSNLTGDIDRQTLRDRLDNFMVINDLVTNEGTLNIPQYPRNVLIRMMQMKPMRQVIQVLGRRPMADVTALRKCGALKSVFGLKETLNQYSSTGDIQEYEKGVLRDENYWLMGISARGFESDEGPPLAVMIADAPFVIKESDISYKGIAAELFHATLQEMLKDGIFIQFDYVEADSYGTKDGDDWNGVFGILQKNKAAKVGVGQISRTTERMAEFDFTEPFGYSYRTFIRKKSLLHEHYSFIRPFTPEVWAFLLLVMVVSAVVLHAFDAWNPYKDEIPEGGEFTFAESIWHSFLILTQLGPPFGCHMYPSRVYSLFYWFFALVVVGCYTGNLASFLTTSQYANSRMTLKQIFEDDDIAYGMVGNTSVQDMFRSNLMNLPADYYEKRDFVKNYEEGMSKVRDENYVLFGTSAVLTYYANNDPECALTIEHRAFYSRDFEELSFAIKRDWELKTDFQRAFRRVKESGMLNRIYARWVNFAAECSVEEDDHAPMGVSNFYGLLTFLAVSIFASFAVLAVKLSYFKRRDDLYLPEVFKNELRAELGLSHRPAEDCTNEARRRHNKNLRGKDHRKHSPLIKETGLNGVNGHNGTMNGSITRAPEASMEDIDLDDFNENFA